MKQIYKLQYLPSGLGERTDILIGWLKFVRYSTDIEPREEVRITQIGGKCSIFCKSNMHCYGNREVEISEDVFDVLISIAETKLHKARYVLAGDSGTTWHIYDMSGANITHAVFLAEPQEPNDFPGHVPADLLSYLDIEVTGKQMYEDGNLARFGTDVSE